VLCDVVVAGNVCVNGREKAGQMMLMCKGVPAGDAVCIHSRQHRGLLEVTGEPELAGGASQAGDVSLAEVA
jgi:hypothetical protein